MSARRLVLYATLALTACARPEAAPVVAETGPSTPTSATADGALGEPATPEPSSDSIYLLRTTLTDQRGRRVPLDLHRGHPVLVAMFYGTCTSACPALTADIKAIERRVDPATRAELRVLLVSFDPARDTPEALTRLADRHGVDAARWTLASAPEDRARELAAVLGVQYRRLPGGDFSHSALISLLDRDGVVVSRIDGLRQPADEVVARLVAMKRR